MTVRLQTLPTSCAQGGFPSPLRGCGRGGPTWGLRWRDLALVAALAGMLCHAPAWADKPAGPALPIAELGTWLERIHDAARQLSYRGTFVVTASGRMTSARIVHACDGDVQLERIDVLDGQPRRIFRRDDLVHKLNPDTKVAVVEQIEALKTFPALLQASAANVTDHYHVTREGADRVAGRDADVLELSPKDALRFGHRLWADRATGLLLRTEIVDRRGRVLEASAFSEVTIDIHAQPELIAQAMHDLEGYEVHRVAMQRTYFEDEGWTFREVPAGYGHVQCVKRESGNPGRSVLQSIFSDGLAHVSVFVEPYAARTPRKEQLLGMGATHSLTRKVGEWWVTVVGEVPPATLKAFAKNIERKPR